MLQTRNKKEGVKMLKPQTVCVPLPRDTSQFGKLPLLPLFFAGSLCPRFSALLPPSSNCSVLFPVPNFYEEIQSSYCTITCLPTIFTGKLFHTVNQLTSYHPLEPVHGN